MVGKIYIPNSVKFDSQQSGFAFFGAHDFGCAHFFNFGRIYGGKEI